MPELQGPNRSSFPPPSPPSPPPPLCLEEDFFSSDPPGPSGQVSQSDLAAARIAAYEANSALQFVLADPDREKTIAEAERMRGWFPKPGRVFACVLKDVLDPITTHTNRKGAAIEALDGCVKYICRFKIDDATDPSEDGKTFCPSALVYGKMTPKRRAWLKRNGKSEESGNQGAVFMKELIEFALGIKNAPERDWFKLLLMQVVPANPPIRFLMETVENKTKKDSDPYINLKGIVAREGAPSIPGPGSLPVDPGQPALGGFPPPSLPPSPPSAPAASFVIGQPLANDAVVEGQPRYNTILQIGGATGVDAYAVAANGKPVFEDYNSWLTAVAARRGITGFFATFDQALTAVLRGLGV